MKGWGGVDVNFPTTTLPGLSFIPAGLSSDSAKLISGVASLACLRDSVLSSGLGATRAVAVDWRLVEKLKSCEMSNFSHRQKFELKILPQKRVIPD